MIKTNKLKELGIKQEQVKGVKITDNRLWICETPLQKATRDFVFEVAKSSKLLWLIKKIPFLKYKDWVKVRFENEYEKTFLLSSIFSNLWLFLNIGLLLHKRQSNAGLEQNKTSCRSCVEQTRICRRLMESHGLVLHSV